ncbi:MAG: protein-L-isoaspartate O-methyltransferase [Pseudomonadota bacterium]
MDTGFAKAQMVRQQVRTWDVTDDRILDVLNALNRHEFVPVDYRDLAYAETRIPLPRGQEMMRPLMEGRLLQTVSPQSDESVLEVGTGSGYLAACFAMLARSVTTVDIYDELIEMGQSNLDKANIGNVEVQQMDITEVMPEDSFDVIAVTGSMADFDERLVESLNPGGRLFVVVGDAPVMEARLITRTNDGVSTDVLFETNLKTLVHAERRSTFAF